MVLNFKKIIPLFLCIAFSNADTKKDCVIFVRAVPSFNSNEKALIKDYYSKVAEKYPVQLATMYLGKIQDNGEHVLFYFLSLKYLQSHECNGQKPLAYFQGLLFLLQGFRPSPRSRRLRVFVFRSLTTPCLPFQVLISILGSPSVT